MREPSSPRTPYRRPGPDVSWGGTPRHRAGGTSAKMRAIGTRRWPRRALLTTNVIVAAALITVASAYGYVNWRFAQIHKEKLSALTSLPGGGKAFTLLVVGSDSRAALSGPDNSQFGGAAATAGQRSDTIILVRVVPKTQQLMMLSIPRDLWGNIPGQGQNRINSAFNNGPNLLIQTIQQDLGIPINHYVEVNFDTFRSVSNAVGGVNFYFPTPARDGYSNLNVPAAGCVSLKGDQALAFVRSRHYEYYQNGYWHYEAESDLARIQRQQAFIKKMISKAKSEFTNPIALNSIIAGVTKNLTVDSGFSTNLMLALAQDFRSMNVSGIPNMTLPVYPFVTSGGADVLGLQQPQAAQTIAAFNSFNGTAPPPKPSKKPAKKAPASPATTVPTIPASKITVEVANGTGIAGQAGALTRLLSGYGFVTGLSTTASSGVATTQVEYAPDAAAQAAEVAAKIPGGATLSVNPALTPTAYNVEVITGRSYDGGNPASGGSPTSTSSTSSTTVPGTNASVYELPGSSGPPPANC